MKIKPILTALVLLTLSFTTAYAQLSDGGSPASFSKSIQTKTAAAIPTEITGSVDVASLLSEDKAEEKLGVPMRFGYPFDVELDIFSDGIWETLPDGTQTWRLRIHSPGAFSINILFDDFHLNDDVKLFLYNEDQSMVLGAFTKRNNKIHRKFATAPIKGETIYLELNVPPGVSHPGQVSIKRIVHAYRDLFTQEKSGFGSSGSCNNNVNCPEGTPWTDEINSVAMIILGNGIRWCSGAMVNNVREDLIPYFLTANHCLSDPDNWIIMFNYQSPSCDNLNGPTDFTVHGTSLLATNAFSDFALVELNEEPPDSFNVYYSGWSNIDTPASQTVGIHHPAGDIKKISFNNNAVTSGSYGGGGNSHWRVDDWEDGTTEGGSSGSPLYDENHRIVGQLHGGSASCASITNDYYGKFSQSWDRSTAPSLSLKSWLDPDDTGIETLNGTSSAGVDFYADITAGDAPLTVNFTGLSKLIADSWLWDFGDGNTSLEQNPTHEYTQPGLKDVHLTVTSATQSYTRIKYSYITIVADTLIEPDIETFPDSQFVMVINAANSLPIHEIYIPFEYGNAIPVSFDSFSTAGCRTDYFEIQNYKHIDDYFYRRTIRLKVSEYGNDSDLPAGSGPIIKLFLKVGNTALPGDTAFINIDGYNNGFNDYLPVINNRYATYNPKTENGHALILDPPCCLGLRGNVNGDPGSVMDIDDIVYLINYAFGFPSGPDPPCMDEADANADAFITIDDVVILVDYMFGFPPGPDPQNCPE